jgi:hypothetical protein
MATTYKVRYKNHCTPQEQISSGGRYYLDSDAGRKFTRICDSTAASGTANGTLTTGVAITDSATQIASSKDFIYVKNTGSTDVLVTLDNSNYMILLSEDEAFASDISTSADVRVKTSSGTSTIEHFSAT